MEASDPENEIIKAFSVGCFYCCHADTIGGTAKDMDDWIVILMTNSSNELTISLELVMLFSGIDNI